MGFIGYKRSSVHERPGGALSKPEERFQKCQHLCIGTKKHSAGILAKEHVHLGMDVILYIVGSQNHVGCLLCIYYPSSLSHFSLTGFRCIKYFQQILFAFFPQLFSFQPSSLFSMEVLNKLQQYQSPNK